MFPLLAALLLQDLPAEKLDALKAATVFVKVEHAGGTMMTTGFLVKVDGETGYVLTSCAAIDVPVRPPPTITMTFRSGTKDAARVRPTIAAFDPACDFAIFKVQLKNLPAPVDVAKLGAAPEKAALFAVGFPTGDLQAADGFPPVQVAAAKSLGTIKPKDQELILIDADIQPGMTGGAVVDAKGALAGVVHLKILGIAAATATPAVEIPKMLLGRVTRSTVKVVGFPAGKARVQADLFLVDPTGALKDVAILIAPENSVKAPMKPAADGSWGPVDGLAVTPATAVNAGLASATIEFPGEGVLKCLYQIRYTRGDGRTIHTPPDTLFIDFNLKNPAAALLKAKRDAVVPGKPEATGTNAAAERKTIADAAVTRIAAAPFDVFWSVDGKALIVLETGGLLRRISMPDVVEERRVALNGVPLCVRQSKEGLLILMKDLQELWVVSEATLDVLRRLDIGDAKYFASSPASAVAFVIRSYQIVAFDVAKGAYGRVYDPRKLTKEQFDRIRRPRTAMPGNFNALQLSPDGRHLFANDGGALARLKVDGEELTYEEMGFTLTSSGRIVISPDSRYVALTGSNQSAPGHPPLPRGGLYVYAAGNLLDPVGAARGMQANVGAIDGAASKIYLAETSCPLAVCSLQGVREAEYTLAEITTAIVPHPAGRRVAASTSKSVLIVDLPEKAGTWKPKPPPTGLMPAREVGGAKISLVKGAFAESISGLMGSADGKSVFVNETRGRLIRYSLPDLVPVQEAELCFSSIARSKEGIVGLWTDTVVVVDEAKLQVKARVLIEQPTWLVASPSSSFAFVSSGGFIVAIDLKKGAIAQAVKVADLAKGDRARKASSAEPLRMVTDLTLSPDGAWLMVRDGSTFHRFAVKGAELTYVEASHALPAQKGWFSADSQQFLVPVYAKKSVPDHPEIARAGVYVYKAADLQKPAVTLQLENAPAWAGKSGSGYLAAGSTTLVVFGSTGAVERTIQAGAGEMVLQPDGKRGVFHTSQYVSWIELGK